MVLKQIAKMVEKTGCRLHRQGRSCQPHQHWRWLSDDSQHEVHKPYARVMLQGQCCIWDALERHNGCRWHGRFTTAPGCSPDQSDLRLRPLTESGDTCTGKSQTWNDVSAWPLHSAVLMSPLSVSLVHHPAFVSTDWTATVFTHRDSTWLQDRFHLNRGQPTCLVVRITRSS